jgi:hypothetical protein
LLLFLTSCNAGKKRDSFSYISLENYIYKVSSSGTCIPVKQIDGFFSGNSFTHKNKLIVYAKLHARSGNEEGIYTIDKSSWVMNILIKDTASVFIVQNTSIITIGKSIINDSGFIIKRFKFDDSFSKILKQDTLGFLNSIVNDWSLTGNFVLTLSGRTFDGQYNNIVQINLQSNKIKKLWKKPASGNFFKLVSSDNALLSYSSGTTPETKTDSQTIIRFELFQNELVLKSQSNITLNHKFQFFGKGTYFRNFFILPLLDSAKSSKIAFISADSSLQLKTVINTPTLLYKFYLTNNSSVINCAGYNFFIDPSTFYFFQIDCNTFAVKNEKPLIQHNQ